MRARQWPSPDVPIGPAALRILRRESEFGRLSATQARAHTASQCSLATASPATAAAKRSGVPMRGRGEFSSVRGVRCDRDLWVEALEPEWAVGARLKLGNQSPTERATQGTGRRGGKRESPRGTVQVQSLVARMNAYETLCSVSRSFDPIFAVARESSTKRSERSRNIVLQR